MAILAEEDAPTVETRIEPAERIAPEGKYFLVGRAVLRGGPRRRVGDHLWPRSLLEPFAPVSTPDAFDQFAEECALRLTAEPLCVAPRDVLASLDDLDQHYLVSLTRAGATHPPVRLVFLTPVRSRGPSIRDVLWWLAGDAWVIEQGNREVSSWAAVYGYPPGDEATIWLFEQALRQSAGLERLLGDADMKRLLTLYEAEVGPSRPRS